ncbi:DUF6507 family protein [Arthrobacter sp. zg-Y769]|uniref:DUF6507 family protein n=1 Tax=Arthrobacter sp. zg-Y769 TaxID=2894191 RepID=UPI001E4183C3|nr:DUF6507 family protein [Arthrobacter sp. zg-Y769]MCC9206290.1 DUF6507 family protein [Arthrobacter sp. zg-Y769]
MSAYDIDAAAAGGIISETEALLQPNENVPAEMQNYIGAVEAALGDSRALASFSHYAREMLLPDINALATRSANAILATRRALSEYAAGDYEMVATAQQAAASLGILTPPPEAGPAAPVSPAEPLPDSAPAAHIPAPAPAVAAPVPLPQVSPAPGVIVPGNTDSQPGVEAGDKPKDRPPVLRNLMLKIPEGHLRDIFERRLQDPPPVLRDLMLRIPKAELLPLPGRRFIPDPPVFDRWWMPVPEDNLRDHWDRHVPDRPVATPLPGIATIEPPRLMTPVPDIGFTNTHIEPPQVGIPIPETGNPERGITPQPEIVPGPGVGTLIPGEPAPGQGPDARGVPALPNPDLPVTLPPSGGATPGPAPVVNEEIPLVELFSRADEVSTESAPSPAPRGRWGLT